MTSSMATFGLNTSTAWGSVDRNESFHISFSGTSVGIQYKRNERRVRLEWTEEQETAGCDLAKKIRCRFIIGSFEVPSGLS